MIKEHSLLTEEWREYLTPGRSEPVRIENPQKLFIRVPDGTTHRVLCEDGSVMAIPWTPDTILRWKNKDPDNPCEF